MTGNADRHLADERETGKGCFTLLCCVIRPERRYALRFDLSEANGCTRMDLVHGRRNGRGRSMPRLDICDL
jgi:hypothetical protein